MYIVKNHHDAIAGGGGLGAEMHTEDPGKPNFTPEGLEAAKSSDMDVWSMRGVSAGVDPKDGARRTWSIDGWMALPFHRMPILNPRLTSAGFGLYCESEACAAGLNLLKGSQGKAPAGIGPVEFPPMAGPSPSDRSKTNGPTRARAVPATSSPAEWLLHFSSVTG